MHDGRVFIDIRTRAGGHLADTGWCGRMEAIARLQAAIEILRRDGTFGAEQSFGEQPTLQLMPDLNSFQPMPGWQPLIP